VKGLACDSHGCIWITDQVTVREIVLDMEAIFGASGDLPVLERVRILTRLGSFREAAVEGDALLARASKTGQKNI
jgi:hypothetical protein